MDPKPSPPPPPPPDEPPRRRGAAGKRKARAAPAAATPSPPPKRQARERNPSDPPPLPPPSPPPKRQARERNPSDPPPPPPLPRSRPPARKPARKQARKNPRKKAPRGPVEPPAPRAEEAAQAPPAPLQPVEQEIEAVLSRGAGVHVVPTFAGWFSWKEIHPIEKQTLCTFFDGKSERRTPEIYLGIRNFIMSKFHFKPQVHLESKDLSELSIGEMDARLEVLEFLAHWGLVNFHPFPPGGQECQQSNADTQEKISLVEKLFQFEPVQSYLVPVPTKADFITPAHLMSLLSEPTLAEDAVTPADSSVEYHCNSCSVDCSRKRYHCRTQADFDLCSDCYNEGKFDEGMSHADFILMESAETPGSGGTSWTDQETLLLLEALEIFQGHKWDDIAEHVATKTKLQCMLYFLQMPILESFLDGEDFSQTFKSIKEQSLAENGTFDVPDRMEVKGNAEGKESTDEKTPKRANAAEAGTNLDNHNVSQTKNSGDNGVIASSIVDESNKSSDTDHENKKTSAEFCVSDEHVSNFVVDVLASAFEAVCHFPEKKDMGSFADAGNPVMALAAFLAGLAEHGDAVTSCYSSLRAISERSPALQLATRHCFILQDPPNDLKDATVSASPARTCGEQHKGDDATPNADDTDKDSGKKEESGLTLENQDAAASLGDKTDPERVERNKLSSEGEGLPADISPSQGKIEQEKIKHAPAALPSVQHESCRTASGITEEPNSNKNIAANDDSIKRLRRAAGTAISAAAVKAKLLADLEEDQIRPLAALVIQKQFQKIEVKMSFLAEIENLVLRARGLNENIRKKLLMERNAIIASRMAAAQSRPNQHGAPGTRLPVGYALNQHLTRP
ncbi:hypothetical protein ACP70R_009185 [Stipagrostis hirtigluma subsp. patula]